VVDLAAGGRKMRAARGWKKRVERLRDSGGREKEENETEQGREDKASVGAVEGVGPLNGPFLLSPHSVHRFSIFFLFFYVYLSIHTCISYRLRKHLETPRL
jgi:hypothetical protein